jgi:hypothetical protein
LLVLAVWEVTLEIIYLVTITSLGVLGSGCFFK